MQSVNSLNPEGDGVEEDLPGEPRTLLEIDSFGDEERKQFSENKPEIWRNNFSPGSFLDSYGQPNLSDQQRALPTKGLTRPLQNRGNPGASRPAGLQK